MPGSTTSTATARPILVSSDTTTAPDGPVGVTSSPAEPSLTGRSSKSLPPPAVASSAPPITESSPPTADTFPPISFGPGRDLSLPTRVPVKCNGCQAVFFKARSALWHGTPGIPLYCSKVCQYGAAWLDLTCEGCGSPFRKRRAEADKAARQGLTKTFCTRACWTSWMGYQTADRLTERTAPPLPASTVVTDEAVRTETGRRRYYSPDVAALSDGANRLRACAVCGKVRKGKAVLCRGCWMQARADTYLTLHCVQCGSEFTRMRAEHEKALRRDQRNFYCSHKCASAALTSLGCPCLKCGRPTGSKDRGRRYCSKGCRLAVSRAGKEIPCPQCGREFFPKSKRTVYCDRICANDAHSQRMIGAGNSHYKDGTSYADWFRKMRPLIFERDGRICRVCETVDRMVPTGRGDAFQFKSLLLVHHINEQPWDNRPENLILLCASCHITHHKSKPTPYPWFGSYAERATSYMTSRWTAQVTSLQTKYSSTTA